ncbi:hypothetical protein TNCV_1118831 [Trichonephila clavipes]|uniref:Uncharacterized protein n=1 Tax=Trichonephila clavipes TaxID=2585209 RepID=A0A8X6VSD6_TRICX|nr:hypothetical protein TNCV_1118831 [Trichonephila clavipes]
MALKRCLTCVPVAQQSTSVNRCQSSSGVKADGSLTQQGVGDAQFWHAAVGDGAPASLRRKVYDHKTSVQMVQKIQRRTDIYDKQRSERPSVSAETITKVEEALLKERDRRVPHDP